METADLTPWPTTVLATLTNHGYALYTLNLLKSLAPFGLDRRVLVCCLDSKAAVLFRERGYPVVDLGTDMDAFCAWNKGAYDRICYMKMRVQHAILSQGKNVLMIDGDIVFVKDPAPDLVAWEADHATEVYVQNDAQVEEDHKNLCAGFMFVRATENMQRLFDTETEEGQARYRRCAFDNNDQLYFNDYIKPHAAVKALPLQAYPNGKMFMDYMGKPAPETVLVHYNWLHGHQKVARMKQYRMWLLEEKEEELDF